MEMRYWLMKSEPSDVSIDDLASMPDQTVAWYGVRNYQARNFMRDEMKVGDLIFFYHSSCEIPGIAGIASVASLPYPDPTQFDKKSEYFDPKATKDHPRWFLVDVKFEKEIRRHLPLEELKNVAGLKDMRLLQKGNRLSILPVTPEEYEMILKII